MTGKTLARAVAALLAVLLANSASAQGVKKPKFSDIENIGNRDINKGDVNNRSIQQEIQEGRTMGAMIERGRTLLGDPATSGYMDRVVQELAKNSDAKIPITLKIIRSGEVNGVALPGGFLYVNTGLILAMDNESELAAALAHLVAQVAIGATTENWTRGMANIQTEQLVVVGGPIGMAARQLATIAIPLKFVQFSRAAVTEADFLGLQYLYKTGYDPQAAVRFLQKLEALEPSKSGTISMSFATHPPAADRIKAVRKNIDLVLPRREQNIVTTPEFDEMKARLATLN